MNHIIQFFSEPFNWVLFSTVILTFVVEHHNYTRTNQTVRVQNPDKA